MKPSAKLMKLALVSLLAPLLASCQNVSKTPSSTIERTAEDVRAIERAAICTALEPEKVSRESYDASPKDVQDALAGGAAAWVRVCQPA